MKRLFLYPAAAMLVLAGEPAIGAEWPSSSGVRAPNGHGLGVLLEVQVAVEAAFAQGLLRGGHAGGGPSSPSR